jgi:hypothetical protein
MHTVTCKLNKDARQHQNGENTTFFLGLGEQNYDFKTKEKVWTNYDAAIFAKGGQVQFYADQLRAGAVVTVTGTGLIVQLDPTGQYPPKLAIQDAKLAYSNNELCGASQPAHAPQQQMAPQQQAPQNFQQAPPMQQAPQPMAPNGQPPYTGDVPY